MMGDGWGISPGWLTMVGLRADSTEPPTMPPTNTEMKPHRKKMPKIWRSRPDSEGFLQRYCAPQPPRQHARQACFLCSAGAPLRLVSGMVPTQGLRRREVCIGPVSLHVALHHAACKGCGFSAPADLAGR